MGGRKRRQETTTSLRSTSLRRDTISTAKTTPNKYTQQVKIGCMSGIFQFVSKYHTRHKFLTFGKKQECEAISRKPRSSATCQSHNHKTLLTQVTLEVPRSPAIPAEIRRRASISPPSSPPKAATHITSLEDATTTEVAAEKRRKLLLGALEKCDEDLQALKRIIKAVRDVQSPSVTPPPRRGGRCGGEEKEAEEGETETESDEPSPVSVLDHHRVVSRSPNISCTQRTREVIKNEFKCLEQPTRQHSSTKKAGPEEDNTARMLHFQKEPYTSPFLVGAVAKTLPPASRWSSETRETVIEVCKDVECGLRLEVDNFGFLLQHFIFRDLLDEFINELETPNDACKRKLSF